jgi:hypothetical protein
MDKRIRSHYYVIEAPVKRLSHHGYSIAPTLKKEEGNEKNKC